MSTTIERDIAVGIDPTTVGRLQRRTLLVLATTQVVGGAGIAVGITVGALLAARMAGTGLSGLAQSALVVGTALFAVPITRVMTVRGRRPGLGLAYGIGAVGAMLVVAATAAGSLPLLLVGLFLFGAGSTGNMQARYAAADLAEPARRGRHLSLVVWATAVGSIAGPNLAPLADRAWQRWGLVEYAGPFLASTVAFVVAVLVVMVALRPDPLVTARALDSARAAAARPAHDGADTPPRIDGSDTSGDGAEAANTADPTTPDGPASPPTPGTVPARRTNARGVRAAVREVAASPPARLGLAAMTVGHIVMISVMTMTPVHIDHQGHPDSLRIIGWVLSVHIAGMYLLSPVVGWLTDRVGRRGVILGGIGLLVAACAVAGLSGPHTGGLSVGLGLLGMGWSATMVSGSTLLTESVGLANRASVQGLADLVMGLGGATAGALAGVVVAWSSYATLTVVAGLVTVPLLAAALRPTVHSGRPTVHSGRPTVRSGRVA
ncbi:MAG: MFS transporter [Micromonosporaceae bacterium]|nr:MFS transporter [Micromonosporaceae bacterium]